MTDPILLNTMEDNPEQGLYYVEQDQEEDDQDITKKNIPELLDVSTRDIGKI